jgi:hypothetical protein
MIFDMADMKMFGCPGLNKVKVQLPMKKAWKVDSVE